MNQIKWAFSFLGKSRYKLYTAYLFMVLSTVLMAIDPHIVKKIVNDVLYPMFEDPSIPTSTFSGSRLPSVRPLKFARLCTKSFPSRAAAS